MKNEDMKMLCKDVKEDLRPARSPLKFLLLFFVSFTLNAQIHINGFCSINSYSTNPNFSNIFLTDFNGDNKNDILLFNEETNNLTIHASADSGYLSPLNKFFYFPISYLEEFGINDNKDKQYLFLSRKERLAGLVSITKYGTLQLLNVIRFESIPSKINTTHTAKKNKYKALIYGEAFEGISILTEKKFTLSENKISQERIFSSALFMDVNYDSFDDIIAFDPLKSELAFFYNVNGEFEQLRTLRLTKSPIEIQKADFNKDGFYDLFLSFENSFEIFLGDSVSSFEIKRKIKNIPFPDKSFLSDINKDGLVDITFFSEKDKKLYAIFSDDLDDLSESVEIFEDSNLIDFTLNNNPIYPKIFTLNKSGMLNLLQNIRYAKNSDGLISYGKPAFIAKLNDKNGRVSTALIDNQNFSLKLMISHSNLFSDLISQNLSAEFKQIVINQVDTDNKIDSVKTIVLYNKNDQLMEILLVNTFNLTGGSYLYYNDLPVIDVCLKEDKNSALEQIYILNKNYANMGISKLDFKNSRYIKSQFDSLDTGVYSASIFSGKYVTVYYWKVINDSLSFIEYNLDLKTKKILLSLAVKNNYVISEEIFKVNFGNYIVPAVILSRSNLKRIVLFDRFRILEIPLPANEITNIIKIESLILPNEAKKYLYLLCNNGNDLYEVMIFSKFNYWETKKIIESEKVYDYFAASLNNIPYLFYIGDSKTGIKLKKIINE